MRRAIVLVILLSAASAIEQSVPAPNSHDLQILSAKVIQYNRPLMLGTYEGDLIVRADGSGQFFHLVYSPYDFGFESPPADASQLLPRSMTADSFLLWTFSVHPPWNFREADPCKAARNATKEEDEKASPRSASVFVSVPGVDAIVAPPLASLPCLVIERWSGGSPAQPDAAHPVRAAL